MFIIQKRLFLLLLCFATVIKVAAYQVRDPVTTVSINAIGGLQYDLARFQVKPGAKVKIILTNKDDMSHNLVITKPGARIAIVNAAINLGEKGIGMNYVPRLSTVLWFTKLLPPGESTTISFTAPKQAGVYPYVCSYPGHGFVMFGAMYVTEKGMPAIKNDLNIPPNKRNQDSSKGNNDSSKHQHAEASKPAHPYKEIPPFLYRIFVPGASPAAITVSLPQQVSYCWDAGTCRLAYAWQGDFLDNTEIWKGHHDAYAKILGTIFFRDKTKFPFCVDKPGFVPAVEFKGYRLMNRYPEFHYTIDGIDVYELLKAKADGSGLTRAFRIPESGRIIWFICDPDDGVTYESSVGKWVNGKLKLLPEQAHQFTITMTKKKS
jgi:azurin